LKEILKSKYSRFFIAGLVLNILCAWFSVGFHHADEHFQILELCNYKMGHSPASDLSWEFQQKVRASLLPYIAYGFAKLMDWCGVYNPFILVFILRLIIGIATWFIVCKFCLLFSSKSMQVNGMIKTEAVSFKTPAGEKLLVLMSLFLWFVPYLNVRFTSENLAGLVLLYGVYIILRKDEKDYKPGLSYLLAGLFFGVSFFIRSQMVFAIAGFIAWLFLVRKIRLKYFLLLLVSSLLASGLNVLLDYRFYGQAVFTPYNYYYANIILNKAAGFGINPWWYYFYDFLIVAVPPLSLILLCMFITGIAKNLKDPMVWIILPFFIAHCFIGHKELRFLFPVIFIFIYLSAKGFDYFLQKEKYRNIHAYFYYTAMVISIPLLIYRTVAPANVCVNYFKYLYENETEKNMLFFVLTKDEYYRTYGENAGFYRNTALKTISVDSISQMGAYLQNNKPASVLLLSGLNAASPENIKGYTGKLVYCYFPEWILKFDFNHWEERTQIWSIYRFDRTE
jgi:GPI mannosyltransferase 3